jgi:hypothetical protein
MKERIWNICVMILTGDTEVIVEKNPPSATFSFTKYSIMRLMDRQFVVTHITRQTEISALFDIWLANTPSVKMLCSQKENCFSLYFYQNITCLSVDLLRMSRFFVFYKTVYGWVTINCCFMGDNHKSHHIGTYKSHGQSTQPLFKCIQIVKRAQISCQNIIWSKMSQDLTQTHSTYRAK